MTDKTLSVNDSMRTSDEQVFGSRHYLSGSFLKGACRHLKHAREAEAGEERSKTEEQRIYVMTGWLASVAFMEAVVNEFFLDLVDGGGAAIAVNPETDARWTSLAKWWNNAGGLQERESILDKYRICFDVAGLDGYTSKDPWQSARDVVKVRDALVHYKPVTQSGGRPSSVGEMLRSRGFRNPLRSDGNHAFPDQVLCADGLRWAIASCWALSEGMREALSLNRWYAVEPPDLA